MTTTENFDAKQALAIARENCPENPLAFIEYTRGLFDGSRRAGNFPPGHADKMSVVWLDARKLLTGEH